MTALTRDEIIAAIAARKAEVEPIEVPEWGGTVYARRLSAGDAEKTGLFKEDAEQTAEMTIGLIITCLTDEAGERIFSDEDVAHLTEADFPVVMRVFAEVAKVNGLAAEALDEAIAAFAAAQPSASSSS